MTFTVDTKNNCPLNNKLGKLSNVYVDCNSWESYKDYEDVEQELSRVVKNIGNKVSSIDELVMMIQNTKFHLDCEHSCTELKGTVDKMMFDVDGIWVDCFFDDGNEYFVSFLFEWTNEPVIAYR